MMSCFPDAFAAEEIAADRPVHWLGTIDDEIIRSKVVCVPYLKTKVISAQGREGPHGVQP